MTRTPPKEKYSGLDMDCLTPQSIYRRWGGKTASTAENTDAPENVDTFGSADCRQITVSSAVSPMPSHGSTNASLASEDACLALIDALFPSRAEHNPLGRGDDCALLVMPGQVAMSTDTFLEDSHFRTRYFSPREVGAKALASAVSDLGAAGAIPLGFSLDLMIPATMPTATLQQVLEGMAHVAEQHDILLTGGDIAKTKLLGLCVTVWGKSVAPQGNFFFKRAVARPRDIIFCIGSLGLAKAGLLLFEEHGRPALQTFPIACQSHLWPRALTDEGVALARFALQYAKEHQKEHQKGCQGEHQREHQRGHCKKRHEEQYCHHHMSTPETTIGLMDVSDGLAQDIPRLLGMKATQKSPLGANLSFASENIPQELHRAASQLHCTPESLMLSGGEDYALLGTCPAPIWEALKTALPAAYAIGNVTTSGVIQYQGNDLGIHGFDHFR